MEYILRLLPALLSGLDTTLKVFFLTLILSIPLGVLVAVGRLSKIKPLVALVELYIWVMRDTAAASNNICIFWLTHRWHNL